MSFLRNIWYVAAWSRELDEGKPLGRVIIGEPVVVWRRADGKAVAMTDRCPHRHAPLSFGRVNGDTIQCMYHGMKFSEAGKCLHVPGSEIKPANSTVKTYPVAEKYNWVWVWLGDPSLADEDKIPNVYGDENWRTTDGHAIEYDANYELINDNLTDLSHLDFVHETTLGAATGHFMSNSMPDIHQIEGGLLIEKWIIDPLDPSAPQPMETWSSYRYLLPGLFLLEGRYYPVGTAQKCGFKAPPKDLDDTILAKQLEQQAVTPISDTKTRYLYTTNYAEKFADQMQSQESWIEVTTAAFLEDKTIIEAQQRIWNLTSDGEPRAFIPQDKAPSMFRKLIQRMIEAETQTNADSVPAE